jgi:hypothetical protein
MPSGDLPAVCGRRPPEPHRRAPQFGGAGRLVAAPRPPPGRIAGLAFRPRPPARPMLRFMRLRVGHLCLHGRAKIMFGLLRCGSWHTIMAILSSLCWQRVPLCARVAAQWVIMCRWADRYIGGRRHQIRFYLGECRAPRPVVICTRLGPSSCTGADTGRLHPDRCDALAPLSPPRPRCRTPRTLGL